MERPPILEGAEFRLVWEEYLDRAARRRIQQAVRRGEAIDDPGFAALAVSHARKIRQSAPIALAVQVLVLLAGIGVGTWLLSNGNRASAAEVWWLTVLPVTMIGTSVVQLLRIRGLAARAGHAEQLNLSVLEALPPSEG